MFLHVWNQSVAYFKACKPYLCQFFTRSKQIHWLVVHSQEAPQTDTILPLTKPANWKLKFNDRRAPKTIPAVRHIQSAGIGFQIFSSLQFLGFFPACEEKFERTKKSLAVVFEGTGAVWISPETRDWWQGTMWWNVRSQEETAKLIIHNNYL